MAIQYGLPTQRFLAYDGTNSTEVVEAAQASYSGESSVTEFSEEDDVLTFTAHFGPYGPSTYTLNVGDLVAMDGMGMTITAEDWATKYIKTA